MYRPIILVCPERATLVRGSLHGVNLVWCPRKSRSTACGPPHYRWLWPPAAAARVCAFEPDAMPGLLPAWAAPAARPHSTMARIKVFMGPLLTRLLSGGRPSADVASRLGGTFNDEAVPTSRPGRHSGAHHTAV